ncbi:MarR family winged helix-turn-helix transcriptional regulator [Acinetobacter sp. GXMZU3951]
MSKSEELLKLDNQLCFALYSTNLALNQYYRKLLQPHGITYPQYLVMLILWEQDQLTVSEIGERIFLESSTLTPLLKRLESLGLIERKRSVEDERRVLISLTDQGKVLKQAVLPIPEQILNAIQCMPDQVTQLREELHRLRTQLKQQ